MYKLSLKNANSQIFFKQQSRQKCNGHDLLVTRLHDTLSFPRSTLQQISQPVVVLLQRVAWLREMQ